jgi:hypothetical protein
MTGHLTKASEHSPNTRAAVELVDQEAKPLGVLRGLLASLPVFQNGDMLRKLNRTSASSLSFRIDGKVSR